MLFHEIIWRHQRSICGWGNRFLFEKRVGEETDGDEEEGEESTEVLGVTSACTLIGDFV